MTAPDTLRIMACVWCGKSFVPNTHGRPRVYCGVQCRQDHGHHVEDLPAWEAELATLEASAAGHERVPVFLRNRIAELRAAIDRDGRSG